MKNQDDDNTIITAKILYPVTVDGHTEYVIRVQRSALSWEISKRYNDFYALNQVLSSQGANDLPLPGKKFLGTSNRDFIAQRQIELQKYLNTILDNLYLSSSLPVRRFLDSETNYRIPFENDAVVIRTILSCLLEQSDYKIDSELIDIGWRCGKKYFQVNRKEEQVMILSYTSRISNEKKIFNDRSFQSLSKSLLSLDHPNIVPFHYLSIVDDRIVAIQPFFKNGSLRDRICGTKPICHFIRKYYNSKQNQALDLKDVRLFGIHLLRALKFLKDKGLSHGNLHTGNIFIHDGRLLLGDLTNYLAGLSGFFTQITSIVKVPSMSMENLDVYCFGLVLYEMIVGKTIFHSDYRIPENLPENLVNILHAILSATSSQNFPSLEQLLSNSFFNVHDDERVGTLKFSTPVKKNLENFKHNADSQMQIRYFNINLRRHKERRKTSLADDSERRRRKQLRKKSMDPTFQEQIQEKSSTETSKTPSSKSAPTPPPPPPIPSVQPQTDLTPSQPPLNLNSSRSDLLGSITQFNKEVLKKVVTVDKSKPIL